MWYLKVSSSLLIAVALICMIQSAVSFAINSKNIDDQWAMLADSTDQSYLKKITKMSEKYIKNFDSELENIKTSNNAKLNEPNKVPSDIVDLAGSIKTKLTKASSDIGNVRKLIQNLAARFRDSFNSIVSLAEFDCEIVYDELEKIKKTTVDKKKQIVYRVIKSFGNRYDLKKLADRVLETSSNKEKFADNYDKKKNEAKKEFSSLWNTLNYHIKSVNKDALDTLNIFIKGMTSIKSVKKKCKSLGEDPLNHIKEDDLVILRNAVELAKALQLKFEDELNLNSGELTYSEEQKNATEKTTNDIKPDTQDNRQDNNSINEIKPDLQANKQEIIVNNDKPSMTSKSYNNSTDPTVETSTVNSEIENKEKPEVQEKERKNLNLASLNPPTKSISLIPEIKLEDQLNTSVKKPDNNENGKRNKIKTKKPLLSWEELIKQENPQISQESNNCVNSLKNTMLDLENIKVAMKRAIQTEKNLNNLIIKENNAVKQFYDKMLNTNINMASSLIIAADDICVKVTPIDITFKEKFKNDQNIKRVEYLLGKKYDPNQYILKVLQEANNKPGIEGMQMKSYYKMIQVAYNLKRETKEMDDAALYAMNKIREGKTAISDLSSLINKEKASKACYIRNILQEKENEEEKQHKDENKEKIIENLNKNNNGEPLKPDLNLDSIDKIKPSLVINDEEPKITNEEEKNTEDPITYENDIIAEEINNNNAKINDEISSPEENTDTNTKLKKTKDPYNTFNDLKDKMDIKSNENENNYNTDNSKVKENTKSTPGRLFDKNTVYNKPSKKNSKEFNEQSNNNFEKINKMYDTETSKELQEEPELKKSVFDKNEHGLQKETDAKLNVNKEPSKEEQKNINYENQEGTIEKTESLEINHDKFSDNIPSNDVSTQNSESKFKPSKNIKLRTMSKYPNDRKEINKEYKPIKNEEDETPYESEASRILRQGPDPEDSDISENEQRNFEDTEHKVNIIEEQNIKEPHNTESENEKEKSERTLNSDIIMDQLSDDVSPNDISTQNLDVTPKYSNGEKRQRKRINPKNGIEVYDEYEPLNEEHTKIPNDNERKNKNDEKSENKDTNNEIKQQLKNDYEIHQPQHTISPEIPQKFISTKDPEDKSNLIKNGKDRTPLNNPNVGKNVFDENEDKEISEEFQKKGNVNERTETREQDLINHGLQKSVESEDEKSQNSLAKMKNNVIDPNKKILNHNNLTDSNDEYELKEEVDYYDEFSDEKESDQNSNYNNDKKKVRNDKHLNSSKYNQKSKTNDASQSHELETNEKQEYEPSPSKQNITPNEVSAMSNENLDNIHSAEHYDVQNENIVPAVESFEESSSSIQSEEPNADPDVLDHNENEHKNPEETTNLPINPKLAHDDAINDNYPTHSSIQNNEENAKPSKKNKRQEKHRDPKYGTEVSEELEPSNEVHHNIPDKFVTTKESHEKLEPGTLNYIKNENRNSEKTPELTTNPEIAHDDFIDNNSPNNASIRSPERNSKTPKQNKRQRRHRDPKNGIEVSEEFEPSNGVPDISVTAKELREELEPEVLDHIKDKKRHSGETPELTMSPEITHDHFIDENSPSNNNIQNPEENSKSSKKNKRQRKHKDPENGLEVLEELEPSNEIPDQSVDTKESHEELEPEALDHIQNENGHLEETPELTTSPEIAHDDLINDNSPSNGSIQNPEENSKSSKKNKRQRKHRDPENGIEVSEELKPSNEVPDKSVDTKESHEELEPEALDHIQNENGNSENSPELTTGPEIAHDDLIDDNSPSNASIRNPNENSKSLKKNKRQRKHRDPENGIDVSEELEPSNEVPDKSVDTKKSHEELEPEALDHIQNEYGHLEETPELTTSPEKVHDDLIDDNSPSNASIHNPEENSKSSKKSKRQRKHRDPENGIDVSEELEPSNEVPDKSVYTKESHEELEPEALDHIQNENENSEKSLELTTSPEIAHDDLIDDNSPSNANIQSPERNSKTPKQNKRQKRHRNPKNGIEISEELESSNEIPDQSVGTKETREELEPEALDHIQNEYGHLEETPELTTSPEVAHDDLIDDNSPSNASIQNPEENSKSSKKNKRQRKHRDPENGIEISEELEPSNEIPDQSVGTMETREELEPEVLDHVENKNGHSEETPELTTSPEIAHNNLLHDNYPSNASIQNPEENSKTLKKNKRQRKHRSPENGIELSEELEPSNEVPDQSVATKESHEEQEPEANDHKKKENESSEKSPELTTSPEIAHDDFTDNNSPNNVSIRSPERNSITPKRNKRQRRHGEPKNGIEVSKELEPSNGIPDQSVGTKETREELEPEVLDHIENENGHSEETPEFTTSPEIAHDDLINNNSPSNPSIQNPEENSKSLKTNKRQRKHKSPENGIEVSEELEPSNEVPDQSIATKESHEEQEPEAYHHKKKENENSEKSPELTTSPEIEHDDFIDDNSPNNASIRSPERNSKTPKRNKRQRRHGEPKNGIKVSEELEPSNEIPDKSVDTKESHEELEPEALDHIQNEYGHLEETPELTTSPEIVQDDLIDDNSPSNASIQNPEENSKSSKKNKRQRKHRDPENGIEILEELEPSNEIPDQSVGTREEREPEVLDHIENENGHSEETPELTISPEIAHNDFINDNSPSNASTRNPKEISKSSKKNKRQRKHRDPKNGIEVSEELKPSNEDHEKTLDESNLQAGFEPERLIQNENKHPVKTDYEDVTKEIPYQLEDGHKLMSPNNMEYSESPQGLFADGIPPRYLNQESLEQESEPTKRRKIPRKLKFSNGSLEIPENNVLITNSVEENLRSTNGNEEPNRYKKFKPIRKITSPNLNILDTPPVNSVIINDNDNNEDHDIMFNPRYRRRNKSMPKNVKENVDVPDIVNDKNTSADYRELNDEILSNEMDDVQKLSSSDGPEIENNHVNESPINMENTLPEQEAYDSIKDIDNFEYESPGYIDENDKVIGSDPLKKNFQRIKRRKTKNNNEKTEEPETNSLMNDESVHYDENDDKNEHTAISADESRMKKPRQKRLIRRTRNTEPETKHITTDNLDKENNVLTTQEESPENLEEQSKDGRKKPRRKIRRIRTYMVNKTTNERTPINTYLNEVSEGSKEEPGLKDREDKAEKSNSDEDDEKLSSFLFQEYNSDRCKYKAYDQFKKVISNEAKQIGNQSVLNTSELRSSMLAKVKTALKEVKSSETFNDVDQSIERVSDALKVGLKQIISELRTKVIPLTQQFIKTVKNLKELYRKGPPSTYNMLNSLFDSKPNDIDSQADLFKLLSPQFDIDKFIDDIFKKSDTETSLEPKKAESQKRLLNLFKHMETATSNIDCFVLSAMATIGAGSDALKLLKSGRLIMSFKNPKAIALKDAMELIISVDNLSTDAELKPQQMVSKTVENDEDDDDEDPDEVAQKNEEFLKTIPHLDRIPKKIPHKRQSLGVIVIHPNRQIEYQEVTDTSQLKKFVKNQTKRYKRQPKINHPKFLKVNSKKLVDTMVKDINKRAVKNGMTRKEMIDEILQNLSKN